MKEKLEEITIGSSHAGKPCLVCADSVSAEDELVICPRCGGIHHVKCWKYKGGCGKQGCAQIAKAVVGPKPEGDGPPAPISKKVIFGILSAVVIIILTSIFWPKPPDPAGDRHKIVFMGESYYQLETEMTKLTDQFNAENEEIYIDLQLIPPGTINQKLMVLIAANEAPDVMAIEEGRYNHFVEQGALLPLGSDEQDQVIYGIEHPAQLAQFVVWKTTEFPEEALEVLHYFAGNITPIDRDLLEESTRPLPFTGF